jgi:hypothetical protein
MNETFELLDYNSFLNIVKRGKITGRDLLALCQTSKKLNEYCNRSFQVTDSKGDKVGDPIPYYLFYSILTDCKIRVLPGQNIKDIFKQRMIGGRVWACGDNKLGQLGLGDYINIHMTLDPASMIPTLKNIVQISSGNSYSLCLDNQGRVWSFGYNLYGILGLGSNDKSINIPTLIPDLHNIIEIDAGYMHSLCLDDQGKVWGFGVNRNGQLGLGDDNWRVIPNLIPNLDDIVQISAGCEHSLCLDKKGRVWSFGLNRDGQLGMGDHDNRMIPTLIPSLENIVQIATGDHYSLCLDKNGQIWLFGDHYNKNIPTLIPDLQNIIVIIPNELSYIFLDNKGLLYNISQFRTIERFHPNNESEESGIFQVAIGYKFRLTLKNF